MTAESREELLSAYLDGEVTDDERAQVETWLAENSQFRRLHAELVALRGEIQSLPKYQLDHDASGAVLRRAEQAVLRGGEAAPAADVRPARAAWWNRGENWRRVMWPAVAVAAALLILVYDASQRPAEREVARAPDDEMATGAEGVVDDLERSESAPTASGGVPRAGAAPDRGRPPAEPAELRAMPPQTPSLDANADEPRDAATRSLRDMPQPANAPTAAPAAKGALKAESLDQIGPPAAGDVVLQCSPEFLRGGRFEKLLDEQKIKWRRVAGGDVLEKAGRRTIDLYAKRPDNKPVDTVTYVVQGTPQQVNAIVSALGDNVTRRGSLRSSELPKYSAQAAGEAQKTTGITITLVAPVGGVQPAAPAASESP